MGKIFLNPKDFELIDLIKLLNMKSWPKDATITFEQDEIARLFSRLNLSARQFILSFKEYVHTKTFPNNLTPMKVAIKSIAVSSSECERESSFK